MTLSFDSEKFDNSSFDRGLIYTTAISNIIKYKNIAYTNSISNIIKWNSQKYTSEFGSIMKWNNRIYTPEDSSIFKWKNYIYIEDGEIIKWKEISYVTNSYIAKWGNREYINGFSFISKWNTREYTSEYPFKFNWVNISGVAWPLTDYLYVKTIQDEYLFPEIVDGQISIKEGSIAEATIETKSFIPEDARCTFYLKGSTRMFDGISRRCVETSSGTFKTTIQEYLEILKPEADKGGQYLVKNTWHDVELQYLLSSDKPADNDNEIGLLYMAKSAIPWEFFEEYDETNNIFKFEYSGIAYSITEVYEDTSLLTQQVSATALESASGWYHDTANKTLYIRCTDATYPYYHVISVPNIWDFEIPVRIGNIESGGSAVILYWETANGDVPYTTIKNLLTALNLEMETRISNGVCYIDISPTIGSGTSSDPARFYVEGQNILKITEIDRADARSMISGILFDGYGQGAGAVRAGAHINMGRGGRFLRIDDSSIHSQATAQSYAEQYLDDHFLPAKRIKFTVPVEIGDAIDQRRLGDYTHISLPSKKFEQDLRIQEINLKLKPLTMDLVAGDKLITFESQIKAMRDAAEKFRKHLQDEIEEFSWSWNENVDNGVNKTNTFTITDDALKVQKLELTCTTSLFRTDAMAGNSGDEGGGAGDGTADEEESPEDEYAMTAEGEAHTHELTSGYTDAPSATVQVSAKGHTHTYASTSGTPSATATVVTSVTSSTVTPSYGCCTGVNCGKQFLTSVSVGAGSTTTASVASSAHTHSISGTTSGDDSWQTVATYDHTHTIAELVLANEETHRHPISTDGYNPTVKKETTEVAVDPVTKDPAGILDWGPDSLIKSARYYTLVQAPSVAHSPANPSMNLSISISGPGITGFQQITGSPFVIHVEDSIGTVLIDNLVTQSGEYTVKVGLDNNDYPTDKTHINFSLQVNGVIFVDSITKS